MGAGDRTRRMTLELVVEDKPARESLGRIDKSTKQTADQFGKAGKAIKLAMTTVALGAVVKFGAELANRAGMMEGIMRRVGQVFGDNAGEIAKWAETSSSAFGESTTTLQGMAAEIGDLLIPMGLSRDVAAEMSIETLNAANALSEWTGGKVTVEEAASAMTKAFLGEREELKKLGISINEADVKTALLAAGQLQLEGDALKAAKAIVTQELIFSKSADALTAYAEGGDSVIRSQKELKAAVDEAVDALALKMIPAFEKGFEAAKDFVSGVQTILDWFEALPGPVKTAVLALAGFKAALMALSAHPVIAGLALVVTVITKIGDSARNQKQAVGDMKTALEEAGGSAEDAAVAFLEARDGSGELALIAAELGLTLDDVAKAASGDETAMRGLKTAFELAKKEGKLTFEQMGLLVSEMLNVAEATPEAKRQLELLAVAEMIAAQESTNLGADLIILGSDMGEVEGDTDDLAAAISDLAKEERKAVDPLFALGDAQDKYAEVLETVQGLVQEGKTGTKEFTDATEDLVKARGDLTFREAEFAEVSVISIQALRDLALEAGLTEIMTRRLISANTTLNNTPVLSARTVFRSFGDFTPDRSYFQELNDALSFSHGGVVPGPVGAPVPALLHGGEVVLNRSQQAAIGGGINIFVEGSVISQGDLVVAVRDGLVELERVNGSTGL